MKTKLDYVVDERTTQKADYTIQELKKPIRYNFLTARPQFTPKNERVPKKVTPVYTQTLQPWTNVDKIKFSMFCYQKEIVRSNPNFTFEKIDTSQDADKEEVIKTRPRVYITPAISMDDINEKEARDIICKNTYSTTYQVAANELKFKQINRDIPNQTREACGDIVSAENYSWYKPLPPEWRIKGKSWEPKQHVTLVDPTKRFWINYKHCYNTPVGRDPFEKIISNETRQEIRDLIEKEELSYGYDLHSPDFTGYRPRHMTGPLRKPDLIALDKNKLQKSTRL